jgi:diadenosine tetraphosphate (Ap4A) HIT family hydrolase
VNRSVVQLDQILAKRQPQAHSSGLARDVTAALLESVGNPWVNLGRDSNPSVTYLHPHLIPDNRGNHDINVPAVRRNFAAFL